MTSGAMLPVCLLPEFWRAGCDGRGNGEHSSDMVLYRFVLPKTVALEIVFLMWKGEGRGI